MGAVSGGGGVPRTQIKFKGYDLSPHGRRQSSASDSLASMCQECLDIGWLDRATRLTWATSRRVGPISPRDFVTRCHYRKLRDGTLVVAQMSEQLPCLEFRANGLSTTTHTRMEVQLCGYILRPIQNGAQTELHMLSLSNPGGIFDTQIGATTANFFAVTGPVNVITAMRKLTVSPRL